ncbi:hypothetical protein DPEC_G00284640 [Dallia pectoralis]|uniref:Uncharacterized protein n=1 Tax=Dallia pectoralis TaxID=75939 RepID=A0ACC2FJI4_DALPE|nr:hypothetical protein DPEC_G00284640 [Dallia pectoralis]
MEFRDYNKYVGFLVFSLCMSMWLMCSGAFRRRLVIDHKKKEYCFYIHSYLHQTGPLHHIYIRIIGQKNGQGVLMYKLILNGHNLEKRELSGLSEKYQLMECQGRRIAKELNLNYFDYQDTSKHHIVVHRPNINISDTNDSSDPPV